jgi:hypothetical protein
MSSNPTQYTGNEMPRYAAPNERRSSHPPGRRALATPMVMPTTAASTIAETASSNVFGNRSAMSLRIGRPVM